MNVASKAALAPKRILKPKWTMSALVVDIVRLMVFKCCVGDDKMYVLSF
jgi:hypothetical protein